MYCLSCDFLNIFKILDIPKYMAYVQICAFGHKFVFIFGYGLFVKLFSILLLSTVLFCPAFLIFFSLQNFCNHDTYIWVQNCPEIQSVICILKESVIVERP